MLKSISSHVGLGLFLAACLGAVGCSGGEPAPAGGSCPLPSVAWHPALAQARSLRGDLPRVMGAYLVTCGGDDAAQIGEAPQRLSDDAPFDLGGQGRFARLFVPVMPLFDASDPEHLSILSPARVLEVEPGGGVVERYASSEPVESFDTGFLSEVEIAGQQGLVARGLRIVVAAAPGGGIFVGNNVTGEIARIDAGGERVVVASGLEGLSSILPGLDGAGDPVLDVSINAILDGAGVVQQPPRIVRITATGEVQPRFTFPASGEYAYTSGFLRGLADGRSTPMGYVIDMARGPDGALFATLSHDRAVFRVDANGHGSALAASVPVATGVAAAADGTVFLAAPPTFTFGGELCMAGEPNCSCDPTNPSLCAKDPAPIEGPRIMAISPEGQVVTVYEAPSIDAYRTGFASGVGGDSTVPVDANFDLGIDAAGQFYLEDALGNEITLVHAGD